MIILLILFGLLFFFKLDYNTIASWDEGWYGSISREIVRSNNWLFLNWNGMHYYDHPPLGFWLMAISYKLFGVSELTTRLPSAIAGLLSTVFIYKLGILLTSSFWQVEAKRRRVQNLKKGDSGQARVTYFNEEFTRIYSKIVGFAAALILGTSVWYLIRVRSGNLDSLFVFFTILTLYLAYKTDKSIKFLPLTLASFGFLLLTKTLVGVVLILPIILLSIHHFKRPKNLVYLGIGIALMTIIVLPWYYANYKQYPDFIQHHFVDIGSRNSSLSTLFQLKIEQPLFYLHMGVRKWYYIWLLAVGYLVVSLKFLKKYIFVLLLTNLAILYPFLTNPKTELWHLIPVYVPMALIISYAWWDIVTILIPMSSRAIRYLAESVAIPTRLLRLAFGGARNDNFSQLNNIIYLLPIIVIALIQIKIFIPEVYPTTKYIPDDVAISKQAGKYKQKLILDDDFLPLAVYYSGKNIVPLGSMDLPEKTLVGLFQSNQKNFVVITRSWAVNNLDSNGLEYKVLDQNGSFSILSR